MKRKNLWILTLVTPLFIACGGGGTTTPSNDEGEGDGGGDGDNPPPPSTSSQYMLTAWNDLGMHCMDGNDFSVFSVLSPYNNLHAQIKDKNGDLITSGVTLTYVAAKGTDGKTNTSSADKTNFWDHSQKLFGVILPKDTGLTGVKTPSLTPQKLTFNATHQ